MRSISTSRSKVSFSAFDAELEREVGLDLGERLELEVDDRLPVGDRDLVERDRVPALP